MSDALWQLVGRALHHIAEAGADEEHIPEERLYAEVLGWRISGAIDVQHLSQGGVDIIDYKFTSAWAALNQKPEWQQQLNAYAWLYDVNHADTKVHRLQVCAFVRDWSRHEVERREDYPRAPIMTIPIELWEPERRQMFIEERVREHQDAARRHEWSDPLPLCTDEERWIRPKRYAVVKEGRKRAIKVFDREKEALDLVDEDHSLGIEVRGGEPIRCAGNYCRVAPFCEQWRIDNEQRDATTASNREGIRASDHGDLSRNPAA